MRKIKEVILEVLSYKDKDFNPSDDAVLECAIKIYLSESDLKKKDIKKPSMKRPTDIFKIKNPSDPATSKQKDKLVELEIDFPCTITKGEANQVISEAIDKSKKKMKDGGHDY